MDVQVNLFLYKIAKLSEFVSIMKVWEPCYESQLLDIDSNLKKLSDSVKQDKCLNAGGKFEWIDSVLVKVFDYLPKFLSSVKFPFELRVAFNILLLT